MLIVRIVRMECDGCDYYEERKEDQPGAWVRELRAKGWKLDPDDRDLCPECAKGGGNG